MLDIGGTKLDYSWIKQGYIKEVNVPSPRVAYNNSNILMEVVSNKRLCPNRALKCVDVTITTSDDYEPGRVTKYTWELMQVANWVEEMDYLVESLAG